MFFNLNIFRFNETTSLSLEEGFNEPYTINNGREMLQDEQSSVNLQN